MSHAHPSSRATAVFMALVVITAALLALDVWMIFGHAPVEEQMGIVQKIFYFHVPSAYAMYIGFLVSGAASAVYLFRRNPAADAWAVAGAELGMLFCVVVLVTGPLWARKAWGIWWTWDPRLTSTMLAGMVFAAYVALRSFGAAGELERRFAAGLAVFGVLDLPIIHYATRRWGGQHPTVITKQGGGLHPDMADTLSLSFVAFTFLAIVLLWARARSAHLQQQLQDAELQAIQRGLLEDR